MDARVRLERLYLLNATVLIIHEIDSAYWHEWRLFNLPGGIQVFLFLHLLLIPVVLLGYREVCWSGRHVKMASSILAGVGLFAALLHGTFILAGDTAFTLPMSLCLIVATFVLSVVQLYTALRFER